MSPEALHLAADVLELLHRIGWTLAISGVLFAALGIVVALIYRPAPVRLRPSDDWQPMPVLWGDREGGER